jgi:hypothetical protein
MKSLILVLFFLGLNITFGQEKPKSTVKNQELTVEELPEVVVKNAGKDFSVYLPDKKNPDLKVRRIEEKFVAYDLGKDYEGNDEYLVVMETKNGSLAANYNENGKLIGVVENYKNVKLPSSVIYSVYKNYPDWKLVKNKYLYSQENGDVNKQQYHIKIKKDKKTKKLIVHPNGDIVKVI